MVISAAVTVAVLAVVFVGIFPKVADYSQAWASIQQMPTAYVVALVGATVVNLAVYVWPLQAALPGLGYGPGFVVRQTSFAISNAVPAGGAVGLGVQYGMLDSYGFGAGATASAIAIVSIFNVFATLVMPVLGVLALLAGGVVEGTYVLMAALGSSPSGWRWSSSRWCCAASAGPARSGAGRTGSSTRSPGASGAAGPST
jgi:uncharacterized membrane protein YbhN (UPF0104 family)